MPLPWCMYHAKNLDQQQEIAKLAKSYFGRKVVFRRCVVS